MTLKNRKIALVTGASGGIGREIAKALAGAGARVALSGTRVGALEETRDALGGGDHLPGQGGIPLGLGRLERTDGDKRGKDEDGQNLQRTHPVGSFSGARILEGTPKGFQAEPLSSTPSRTRTMRSKRS